VATSSPFLLAARRVVGGAPGQTRPAPDRITVDTRPLNDGYSNRPGLVGGGGRAIGWRRARQPRRPQIDRPDGAQRPRPGQAGWAWPARRRRGLGHRRRHRLPRGKLRTIHLPADLACIAWTGTPADTATLVAAVAAARIRDTAVTVALDAIAAAAAFAAAHDAATAIAAIRASAKAMAALAAASGRPGRPARRSERAPRPLGAAIKTTGAGGGDVLPSPPLAPWGTGQIDAIVGPACGRFTWRSIRPAWTEPSDIARPDVVSLARALSADRGRTPAPGGRGRRH
jgi:hypothetical protein